MTATTAGNHRRRPLLPIANLALATSALTVGVVAIISDSPASEGTVAPQTQTPASAQQADNVRVADTPYLPPTHRDATGDSNDARWRDDVQLMPSEWPATEVMRYALQPTNRDAAGDSNEGRWRHDVQLMPSGWPATEVMRHRR